MTKGLESLKELGRFEISFLDEDNAITDQVIKDTEEYKIIKKELEALEIIKEHFEIDDDDFFEMDYQGEHCYFFFGREIDKQKYDILKEVLKNE